MRSALAFIERILELRDPRVRQRSAAFFAEGLRFFFESAANKISFEGILYSKVLLKSASARGILRQLEASGTPSYRVSAEQFRRISVAERASGIAFVAKQRWLPLARVDPLAGSCWLATSGLRSPGNLGSILRTASATGAAGLLALDRSVDPYHPGSLRGSMAAVFQQHFVRTTPQALATWARRHGARLIGASPTAKLSFDQVSYQKPCVLLIGDERKGLSAEELGLCDEIVHIPMCGKVDSLNVSVATGLLLYELKRWQKKQEARAATGPEAQGRTADGTKKGDKIPH